MTTMLSKQQLAQILLVKLNLRHPEHEFAIHITQLQDNPLVQIHVLHHGQKILNCCIDKLYQSYQCSPQDLDNLCTPFLEIVKEFLASLQEEKAMLLPMVITQERLHEIQTAQNTRLPHLPLVANLCVIFVLDKERGIYYLAEEQLKNNFPHQDIRTLHQQAKDNLSLLLPQLKIESSSLFDATLRLDGNYELSMLLIFEQWKHLLPFNTPPAIAIAARDAIIFADSTHHEQVHTLSKVISSMHNNHTTPPLVEQLLTIQNNTLQILEYPL